MALQERKIGIYCMPFVWHSMPFIGINNPSIIPSIRRNIPSVSSKRFLHGFTLLELIVTITIAGILVTLAAAGMENFVQSNRLTTTTNELLTDLNVARSEAIKRGRNVGVCTSNTGTACTASAWTNGWIIFVDTDNSNNFTAGEMVIKIHELMAANTTMAIPAPPSLIVYNRTGILSNSIGAGQYTICNGRLRQTRVIDILPTGRPTLAPPAPWIGPGPC
jgi:type IV fimbrial biogenesis protein FimT